MPLYDLEDLVKQKFGRLTVIRRMPNDKNYNTMWLCKCDCGNETTVCASNLKQGNTKSCGCLNRENNSHPLTPGLSSMRNVITSYKYSAKKKGLDWKLTEEQFKELAQQDCYYCGAKPSNILDRKDCSGRYIYNGLDRIDNTKGYTIDNVVPCCKVCNYRKKAATLEEFKDWIERVYNRMKGDD